MSMCSKDSQKPFQYGNPLIPLKNQLQKVFCFALKVPPPPHVLKQPYMTQGAKPLV